MIKISNRWSFLLILILLNTKFRLILQLHITFITLQSYDNNIILGF